MPLHMLCALFVLSFGFASFVREALTREHQIEGHSMHPTLWHGCLIRVVHFESYSYVFALKVGDVVSFLLDDDKKELGGYCREEEMTLIKRITGIDENGMLFVEGDARRDSKHDSFDSNDFGLVSVSSVRGVWV